MLLPLPRATAPAALAPPPLAERTAYSLDAVSIGEASIALRWHPQPRIAPARSDAIVITGWASDDAAHAPVSEVLAVVDGGPSYRAVTGLARNDVAAALHDPTLSASGFRVTIPPCALDTGHHRIAFRFGASDRRGYYRSGDDVDIDVVPARTGAGIAYSVDALSPPMSHYGTHVLQGWLVIGAACAPARDVRVQIDGRAAGVVRYGIARPDVAKAFGVAAYARSGFIATWTDRPLPRGSHTLALVAGIAPGRSIASGYVLHFVR